MPMIAPIITAFCAIGAIGSHLGMRRVQKIFHIGVHRTATTTFQDYLDRNQSDLADRGIVTWTPQNLRGGLFSGMIRPPSDTSVACERSATMIGLTLARLNRKPVKQLIVSEENMMGTIRVNMRDGGLYPEAGPRLARFSRAFHGECDKIVIGLRNYDSFWTSCFGYATRTGMPALSPRDKTKIATQNRGWRDVIADVKSQFPNTPIQVTLSEDFCSRGKDLLGVMIDDAAVGPSLTHKPICRNTSGASDDPVLDTHTCAARRDRYADDKNWLENGADGLAQLIRPPRQAQDDMRRFKSAKARHAAPYGGYHGTQQTMV